MAKLDPGYLSLREKMDKTRLRLLISQRDDGKTRLRLLIPERDDG
jgi:hypothetical protein